MNEKNKKELLIRIKVNKKNIKRKENHLKDINNRTNIYYNLQGTNGIKKKNSFSNKLSDLSKTDLEPKSIFRNYSQRTYNNQILNEKNINEKGNIICEMQKNKYLKPLLYSKDLYEKILKCKITDSSFNTFHLKIDERNKSISDDSSKKFKEESLFENKQKNKIKKNNLFLLNNLKEFNSNYPIKSTNNNLNGNIKYRNNSNELLNNNFSFNKLKSYDKIYQTCKNFYYQNITYESLNNSNNSFKFYSTKNKYGSYSKKMNNERIGFFCHILEIFFLNIIKKNFKKLIKNLSYISKINSSRSYYTSGKKIYNTNSARYYKNNIFTSDSTINRTSTFSNHFNVFDNNSKIYNECTFIKKNNNSKDLDNFQKRINRIRINKVMKSNSFNTKYKSDSIDISKTFNKRKAAILRKINCERNLPYYSNLLVYKKKNSFSKNSRKKVIKKINKKNINLPIGNKNNINLKNTIESEFDSDGIINKQNLFIFIKCYMIKDINYKIKYLYKYKDQKIIYYDIPLSCDSNINFSIIKQNKNVYKKIKIYKLNKNICNGNKRKYYINIHSYDKTEDGKLLEHKNSIKINLHKKKTIINKENKRNNDNINKILINCVKLLVKIITKLYLKKKFSHFKNYLKNI
jgi:hypothetical protein